MKYYTEETETRDNTKRTAGIKARDDISKILTNIGYKQLNVNVDKANYSTKNKLKKLTNHFHIRKIWKKSLEQLNDGDELIIQFPLINHSLFLTNLFSEIHDKKHVKIILLIHDIEILRVNKNASVGFSTKMRNKLEETNLLNICDVMICHNQKMKEALVELGFDERKIKILGIFDYLIPESDKSHAYAHLNGNIVIAGNLKPEKVAYMYKIPDNIEVNAYGIGFKDECKSNIHYFGSFDPNELPGALDGSFGLVWDGTSINTCEGSYGNYLRINNPHKTSLYIASGLPVVIWSEAALADFVRQNNCGIVVNSLNDLHSKLVDMTEEKYDSILQSTIETSKKLKEGYYTKKVIQEI